MLISTLRCEVPSTSDRWSLLAAGAISEAQRDFESAQRLDPYDKAILTALGEVKTSLQAEKAKMQKMYRNMFS
eukprot:m.429496 g.429496  ORF g.429496 m.429496 type:complete len:73 (+) comp56719_c0_seq3:31-249(+)